MPKNKFLWKFLPSVTVLSDKFNNRPGRTRYSAFNMLLRKRYFSEEQVGNYINTSIFQTIQSKSGSPPSLEKLKAVNYFSRLIAGASLLKSYVDSNPSGHLVSIGGGPRGAMQFNAEVDFLQEHSNDFEELMQAGSVYNMQTTIIEKQGISALTGGVAWTMFFGFGEMNTGAEQGKEARLIKYVEENKEAIEQEFSLNPVANAIFKRACRAKHIFETPLNRALLTRRVVGRELRQHFDQQVKKAEDISIGYTLNVMCDTTVKGIDVSNPLQPIVLAENKDGILGVSADNVRMNIGTVTHCATEDKEVQKLTYWGPMFSSSGTDEDPDDVQGVTAFLKEQGLTDENNKLKKDVTLLVGGSGLSLYDQLLTLQDSMGLFETVPEEEWEAYPAHLRCSFRRVLH